MSSFRDTLDILNKAGEQFKSAGTTIRERADANAKKQALLSYQQNLPQLLSAAKTPEGLAALGTAASRAGDNTIMEQYTKQLAANAIPDTSETKPKDVPMTPQMIKFAANGNKSLEAQLLAAGATPGGAAAQKTLLDEAHKQVSEKRQAEDSASKNSTRSDTLLTRDQTRYDKLLGPVEKDIGKIGRIQHLIEKLKQYDPNDPSSLAATKQIITDINGQYASMMIGKAPGEGVMKDAGLDKVYTKAKEFENKFTAKNAPVLRPEDLAQYTAEFDNMKEGYENIHNQVFKGMVAPYTNPKSATYDPDRASALITRYEAFKDNPTVGMGAQSHDVKTTKVEGAFAPLIEQASKIPDPVKKKEMMDKLTAGAATGKTYSEAAMAKAAADVKAAMGAPATVQAPAPQTPLPPPSMPQGIPQAGNIPAGTPIPTGPAPMGQAPLPPMPLNQTPYPQTGTIGGL